MAAALSHLPLPAGLLASFRTAREFDARPVVATGWEELDEILPDRGFTHGVTELTAPRALGGATTIATSLAAAVQRTTERESSPASKPWVAWIDPEASLCAPALQQSGVDLSRLLVVRPPPEEVRQVAVKLAASTAFSLVVVDLFAATTGRGTQKADELFVRKMSLCSCMTLLLTDMHAARSASLPTVLRLELARRADSIAVRIAKDRMGRTGTLKAVPFRTRLSA